MTAVIEYGALRRELEKAVQSVPFLCTEGDWRQDGWALSADGRLVKISAPLVSAGLSSVWIKIVQTRANGWDGESFHVRAFFDHAKTTKQVADNLAAQFRAQIDRVVALRAEAALEHEEA